MQNIYTKEQIFSQLEKMNIPRNKVVLVHSSLKLVGSLEGGAQTLLDALIEYFTYDGGLLCVPTHTWNNLGKEITLDMSDHSTCLGAFPDIAAKDPRGIRSKNPTHSMAVFGDRTRALEFISDDENVLSGTAPESCYGKLYRDGGYVMLLGVAHNRNTYLHCVDEMLCIPNRMSDSEIKVGVKLESGEVATRSFKLLYTDYIDDISKRFTKYETAFRYHRAITDGFVGNAPTQVCDARIMKNVIEMIFKNSGGADPLADEFAIPPKWYC